MVRGCLCLGHVPPQVAPLGPPITEGLGEARQNPTTEDLRARHISRALVSEPAGWGVAIPILLTLPCVVTTSRGNVPKFRFVIAFLAKSKRLLILWLQLPSAVILEPEKINLSLFPLFPLYLP